MNLYVTRATNKQKLLAQKLLKLVISNSLLSATLHTIDVHAINCQRFSRKRRVRWRIRGKHETKIYFNFNFAEFIVRKTYVREYRVTSFLVLRMICYEIKVKIPFKPIGFRSSGYPDTLLRRMARGLGVCKKRKVSN